MKVTVTTLHNFSVTVEAVIPYSEKVMVNTARIYELKSKYDDGSFYFTFFPKDDEILFRINFFTSIIEEDRQLLEENLKQISENKTYQLLFQGEKPYYSFLCELFLKFLN